LGCVYRTRESNKSVALHRMLASAEALTVIDKADLL